MTQRVEIDDAWPQVIVTVNGNPIRYFDTLSEARAFVDGLFYEGHDRETLENATDQK